MPRLRTGDEHPVAGAFRVIRISVDGHQLDNAFGGTATDREVSARAVTTGGSPVSDQGVPRLGWLVGCVNHDRKRNDGSADAPRIGVLSSGE